MKLANQTLAAANNVQRDGLGITWVRQRSSLSRFGGRNNSAMAVNGLNSGTVDYKDQ